jgi:bacteriocin biosynthesis cyclodehydratase domain-containing protein
VSVGGGGLSRAVLRQLAASGVGTLRLIGEDGAAADVQSAIDDAREAAPETASIAGEALTRDAIAARLRDSGNTFLVVALEAWDPGLLETVNEIALSTRKPWLLVQQRAAAEGLAGPLFVPGQTACYMCMEARIRTNTALFAEYDALQAYLKARGGPSRPWGGLNPNTEILAGMAASETVKYLTGFAPPKLAGRFCAINWFTWGTELHDVLRQPRCAFCRPPRTEVFPWSEIPQPEPESEIAK